MAKEPKKSKAADLPMMNGALNMDLLFRQVLASAQDGIIVYGPDLICKLWNPAMEKISGMPAGDVLGRHPLDVFPFLKEKGIISRLEKALAGEVPETIDFQHSPATGTSGWYSDTSGPLKNENGEVVGVISIVRDITSRKLAEDQSRENEAKLRLVLQGASVVMANIDTDLRYTWIHNPHPDFNESDVLGKRDDEIADNEGTRRLAALKQRVIETGLSKSEEISFPLAEGMTTYHFDVHAIVDDGGKVIGAKSLAFDITERKRVETSLRDSETLLRSIADNYPNSYLSIIEKDLTIGFASGQEFKKLNLDPNKFEGMTIEQVFADKAPIVRERYLKTFAGEEQTFELLVGSRYQSYRTVPLYDSNGAVTRILSVVENITGRRNAEEKLRESELKLSNAVNIARLGPWELDIETGMFTFTDAFYSVFRTTAEREGGYTMPIEEYAGRFVHPDDAPMVASETRKAIETDDPHFSQRLEHRIIYADGESGYISVRYFVVKNEEGRTIKTFGVNQDITERRNAETALRKSEESYRTLLESLPDIVMRFDRDGRHLFVSGNVKDAVGLTAEQFIGKTHMELGFSEDMSAFWEEKIRQVFDSGKTAETEFSFEGANGPVVFNWRLMPEMDDNEKVVSVLTIARDITAHRRTEKEYTTLFAEMLDGLALHEIICDEKGEPTDYRFLSVNPAFERLTGLKGENIIGRTVLEVLPGTEKHWIETYGRVALTGEPVMFENYSKELGTHFEVTAFQSAKGQFTCIFRDINERKRAEEKLLENGKLVQDIIDNADSMIYLIDTEGRFLLANRKLQGLIGAKHENIVGRTREDFFNIETARLHRANDIKVIETGQPIFAEETESLGSEERTYLTIKFPVFNLQGEIYAVGGISTDITDRKKMERALRDEQERMTTILNTVGDPIFVKDNEHRIIVANPAFYDIFCMKEEDVIGKTLVEAVPDNERKHFLSIDRRVLDTGVPDIREETLTVRDFTRTIVTRKTRFVDDSGQRFLVGSIHDVTERRRAYEEARRLQEQLLHSQKMEAVGQLAGGMAHDFNNMLAVILSAAELAKMEIDADSAAQEELRTINEAVMQARELSMKLLIFARRDKVSVTGIEASKIIDNLTGMLSRTIPKNIELKAVVKDKSIIKCDHNQIHQALVNICNNAVDAMPNGGPLVIEVEEVRLPDGLCGDCGQKLDGRYSLIQVTDSGMGMPKDILNRITEPFYTTKGVGKGTGLGLSVTLGIIQSHNGHMHIYSEPGKGTCVKIYLPIDDGSAVHVEDKADMKPLRGTETILVVDDEARLLELAGKLLANKGFKPLLADNGHKAIELYAENQNEIAVVVLDLMMPGMDGAEVNRRLKEINPDVKVIYASGFSQDGVAAGLLKEKNRGFVQKPFEMVFLCKAIREMIDDV